MVTGYDMDTRVPENGLGLLPYSHTNMMYFTDI